MTELETLGNRIFYDRFILRVTPIDERLVREALGTQRTMQLPENYDTGKCSMTVISHTQDAIEAWMNDEPELTGDMLVDQHALTQYRLRGMTLNEITELYAATGTVWFDDPHGIRLAYNLLDAYLVKIQEAMARSLNFRRIPEEDLIKMNDLLDGLKPTAGDLSRDRDNADWKNFVGKVSRHLPAIKDLTTQTGREQEQQRIMGIRGNAPTRPPTLNDLAEARNRSNRNPHLKAPGEV